MEHTRGIYSSRILESIPEESLEFESDEMQKLVRLFANKQVFTAVYKSLKHIDDDITKEGRIISEEVRRICGVMGSVAKTF